MGGKITSAAVKASGYEVVGSLPAKEVKVCCPKGRRVARVTKPGVLRKIRRQYPPEEGYILLVTGQDRGNSIIFGAPRA